MDTSDSTGQHGGATRRRRIVGALALTVAAALLLVAVGTWLNSRAFGQLLAVAEDSEAALEGYNAEVSAVIRRFPGDVATEAQRTSARDGLKAAANETLTQVLIDRQEVRDVHLWPWDRDAIRARDRYLDHLAAWEKSLREVSSGDFDGSGAEIRATFTLVSDALTDAVPLISSDYDSRVAEIVRD